MGRSERGEGGGGVERGGRFTATKTHGVHGVEEGWGGGLGFGSQLEVVTKAATQAACLHSASDQRVLRIDSCSHFQILTT